jgi:hypothetical protein
MDFAEITDVWRKTLIVRKLRQGYIWVGFFCKKSLANSTYSIDLANIYYENIIERSVE